MKYKETYSGTTEEFTAFINKAVQDVLGGKLQVEGKTVTIPLGYVLDYDVKYDDGEEGGSINIKVSWDTTKKVEDEEL